MASTAKQVSSFMTTRSNGARDESDQTWHARVASKVVSGIEVLDAMLNVKTTTAYGLADFPASSVVVLSAAQTK